jgi:polysaccharide biosynthesis/export protein
MVKLLAPIVLVLLAACGNVSGRPPKDTEFDPKGLGDSPPGGVAAMSKEESDGILRQDSQRISQGFPIYPDDELRFSVMGQPDLSFDAKVPAEGAIQFPLIGQISLAGRTLDGVRGEIKERLEKEYLVAANVAVQVRAYAPKRVYVLGAVGAPREYDIPSGRFATLMQAVAQAGGFLEDASQHGVVVYRLREGSERTALTVDVISIKEGKGHDPVLLPNDVVFVPSREKIYVYGQVTRPGAFSVPSDKRLMASQAIALAGGFTRVANDGNVRLSRMAKDGRKTFVLDLAKAAEGDGSQDTPLQPGDVIFVPESVF